jgi:pimeloyl-ACP methyl ester carboxylesterase
MSAQPSTESQGQYIKANGLDIYYEEYGSGEPLILLHGGTQSSRLWQFLIPSFVEHFRVITPDSRGHGRTDNPSGELSYRTMADDIHAFADALGVVHPCILGFSDGAQIALELGMSYPDFARALVAVGAFYKFSEGYFTSLLALGIEGPSQFNDEQVQLNRPELIEYWQTEHARADDPTYWRKLLQQVSVLFCTPLDYTPEEFARITGPILIVLGDRDSYIPVEQALEMYRMIPNAELAIVPNSPHGGPLTHVGALPTYLDFFKRHLT